MGNSRFILLFVLITLPVCGAFSQESITEQLDSYAQRWSENETVTPAVIDE